MTSKNLCFNMMKEDLKQRVWTVALLFLALFFALVIPVAYAGSTPMELYSYNAAQWLEKVTAMVLEWVGLGSPLMVMIMCMAAVVCGASGYSYLHTAKRVDFYHSIPVKRSQLFFSRYINGILMPAVVYLLSLMIALGVASTFGVGLGVTFAVAMKAYAFHMGFFCLMYTTVVIAMIMTGNLIVALLGTTVFFSYGPMIAFVVYNYMTQWFKTAYSGEITKNTEFLLAYTSPFAYYMKKMDNLSNLNLPATVLVILIVTAVLAVFACFLFCRRPSEAAGRAMAFKRTMTPIKILLVIPLSLSFGLLFYSMRQTFGWAVFGLLCGVVITHCLIEIIYHFDFRKLFTHKIHLAVCAAVSFLVLCGFQYDWFGYDTYMPKAEQVRSASVVLNNMDDWVSYGAVVYDEEQDYYGWKYEAAEDYAASHMAITDPVDILSMAKEGILFNENLDTILAAEEQAAEQKAIVPETATEIHNVRYTIRYTLTSGRMVTRSYTARKDDVQEELGRIYNSEDYKTGIYPILSQLPEETVGVNFQQYDDVEPVPETVDIGELLLAYQEDLKGLTYETRQKEMPIATIQFLTREMEHALKYKEEADWNYYMRGTVENRCYYPVYPSFTETLRQLEQAGIQVMGGLPYDRISQVEIRIYSQGGYDEKGDYYRNPGEDRILVYQEEETLKALAPALIFADYYSINRSIYEYRLQLGEITVTMKDGKKLECGVDSSKTPDFLQKELSGAKAD